MGDSACTRSPGGEICCTEGRVGDDRDKGNAVALYTKLRGTRLEQLDH